MQLQLPTIKAYVCTLATKTAWNLRVLVAGVPHMHGDDPLFTQFSELILAHAGQWGIVRFFRTIPLFFFLSPHFPLDFPSLETVYLHGKKLLTQLS